MVSAEPRPAGGIPGRGIIFRWVISRFVILLSAVAVLPFAATELHAAGPAGMAGTMLPGLRAADRNPAMQVLEEPPAEFRTLRPLPVGLLGFTEPERNPLLYQTDRPAFRRQFDFLQFYQQLSHPNTLLLNPGRSPDEVVVTVARDRVDVTDEDGNPLVFREVAGSAARSVVATPLVPPPLARFRVRRERTVAETGLFLGGGGHRLTPDRSLERAIDRGRLEAESSYRLIGSFGAEAGISQSVTFLRPLYLPAIGEVTAAPRLVGFYSSAQARADAETTIITDERARPETVETETEISYFYPGSGGGVGARLDFGLVAERGNFIGGASVLNILGASAYHGMRRSTEQGDEEEPYSERFIEPLPAWYLHGAWVLPLPGERALVPAFDLGYLRTPLAHLGLTYRFRERFARAGVAWDGRPRAALSYGMRAGRFSAEVVATVHEAPFVGGPVYGVGFEFAVIR